MCEKKDCSCDKKETTIESKTFSYNGVDLRTLQLVKNHKPSHAITDYLISNNKIVKIILNKTEENVAGVSTKSSLSELEIDNFPFVIDLKSKGIIPVYDRVEFVISYEDNGVLRKIRRAEQNIIVNIINTKLRKALRTIVNDNNGSVISTTFKELIGCSLSLIIDKITGVIDESLNGKSTRTFNKHKSFSDVQAIPNTNCSQCFCALDKVCGCNYTFFGGYNEKICQECGQNVTCN